MMSYGVNYLCFQFPDILWFVGAVFASAEARGELSPEAPVRDLVEMFIAVPYFRKFIAGAPLDQQWLDSHVEMICRMADENRSPS